MKTARIIIIAIRGVLSLLLIYGVYTETGIFTAIALSSTFLGLELIFKLLKQDCKIINENWEK